MISRQDINDIRELHEQIAKLRIELTELEFQLIAPLSLLYSPKYYQYMLDSVYSTKSMLKLVEEDFMRRCGTVLKEILPEEDLS